MDIDVNFADDTCNSVIHQILLSCWKLFVVDKFDLILFGHDVYY